VRGSLEKFIMENFVIATFHVYIYIYLKYLLGYITPSVGIDFLCFYLDFHEGNCGFHPIVT
jgi:hypothetical protein